MYVLNGKERIDVLPIYQVMSAGTEYSTISLQKLDHWVPRLCTMYSSW